MKMWKKLMVPVLVIVLTSALMGAQYMSIETEATLEIDTEEAALQIAAGDSAVDPDSESDYLLEYEDGFNVNLGTWGEQNEFKSTAAFMLVNAGGSDIAITGLEIEENIGNHIDMWFHGSEHTRDTPDEDYRAWNSNNDGWESEDVELSAIDEPYGGDDDALQVQTAEDTYEEASSESLGDEDHWVFDNDLEIETFDASSNGAWVYIEVDPDVYEDEDITGTLTFEVEEVGE